METVPKEKQRNFLEEKVIRLVAEIINDRSSVKNRDIHPDLTLDALGLNTIEICDLMVSIEDTFDISIASAAEIIATWPLFNLAAHVKEKLLQKPVITPNWKTSFENLIFSGQIKALRTPIEVHLDTTFRCNMRCVFCYDSSGTGHCSEEMSTIQIKDIIDQCSDLDVVAITYGGGEPFLRKDFMELLKHSKKYNIRSFILTNGTLITKEIAREVARCLDLRYDIVQVSLDGPNPMVHDRQRGVPGGFEKTMEGIKNFMQAGIAPIINTVLTQKNYQYIPEMIPFLIEHGLSNYRVLRLHPLGRGRDAEFYNQWKLSQPQSEFINNFLNQKREELIGQMHISDDSACMFFMNSPEVRSQIAKLPGKEPASYACGAGTSKISIAPDGSVYPCSYMYDFPELKIGSLRENTIKELWDQNDLWDLYRNPLTPTGKCERCEYLYHCKTGCRIVSYALYGDMAAPDAGCTYEPEPMPLEAMAK